MNSRTHLMDHGASVSCLQRQQREGKNVRLIRQTWEGVRT